MDDGRSREFGATGLRASALGFGAGHSSCIVGTASLEHLRANVDLVARGPLPADVEDAARKAFRRHGATWPGLT